MFLFRYFFGFGKRIKCIIVIVLICILVSGGILLKVYFAKKAEPKVSYSNVYSEKVKGISELAVLSTTYSGITEVRNKWFIDVFDEVALMEYKAEVKVGVDLSKAKVKVDDQDKLDEVVSAIRSMGYNASTNAEYMESAKKQMGMIQAVLGGIGAVSLLVAAIGIANTMMMSIYERTKEIGIIKVLGCSLKNIREMFLIEAASIGLIGGVAGMVLSYILSAIINFLTGHGAAMGIEGNLSYIPIWLVLVAIAFATLIGTLAGFFPALRAMKLSPLAAIKTE